MRLSGECIWKVRRAMTFYRAMSNASGNRFPLTSVKMLKKIICNSKGISYKIQKCEEFQDKVASYKHSRLV